MRFRLRYLQHDLELVEGDFVIGRSAGCQLSLDDPLVSRRHAVLVVSGSEVIIEDNESRNGVVVNGERIVGKRALSPGDRMVIGSQELMLLGPPTDKPGATPSGLGKQTLTRLPALPKLNPDLAPASGPAGSVAAVEGDTETTMIRRSHAFQLLGGVAEKALALGRADEAERLLAGPVAELMEACRGGKRLPVSLVDAVSRFAAKLATATGKSSWADYVIELYASQARPCPAAVIDELNNAVRRINAIDLVRLREYLAVLHEKQASFGPAERFLLQRIEGLERMAALH
jgi:hypothetical protein